MLQTMIRLFFKSLYIKKKLKTPLKLHFLTVIPVTLRAQQNNHDSYCWKYLFWMASVSFLESSGQYQQQSLQKACSLKYIQKFIIRKYLEIYHKEVSAPHTKILTYNTENLKTSYVQNQTDYKVINYMVQQIDIMLQDTTK